MLQLERVEYLGFHPKSQQRDFSKVQLLSSTPAIDIVSNAYLSPQYACVFGEDGRRVDNTTQFVPIRELLNEQQQKSVLAKQFKHSPSWVEHSNVTNYVAGDWVFGGRLTVHYGHFVCDSLARLWASYGALRGLPIVFTASREAHEQASHKSGFIADVLKSLDRPDFRIQICETRTQFERLHCPLPALRYSQAIHTAYRTPHRAIAAQLIHRTDQREGRVYLSRSKLNQGQRLNPDLELKIEKVFSDLGFEIIFPETMSFQQQVSLFNTKSIIAGQIGSALHTSLFSINPGLTIIALAWNKVPGRFLLADIVNDYRSVYISALTMSDGEIVDCDYELIRKEVANELDTHIEAMSDFFPD